ncbi:MAG: cytochrome C oxidase subunit IV family protein [Acidobacteria bacterium]|nr:cytochrome C oxidase subunit IV family protein [Acidobacteriota bacterium]
MANAAAHTHHEPTTRLFLWVWVGLLGLTGVEVYLAYIHLNLHLMVILLMVLSIVKAAMIMAYFMHLRFERMNLVLTLIPAMIIVMCLMFIVFPDSFRLLNMRTFH